MAASSRDMERAKLVTSDFIRMYYKVMRSFSPYLHLFYGKDSTVVIFETEDKHSPDCFQANNPENIQRLLHWIYDGVNINLFTCIPQDSMDGSILLVVCGGIKRKTYQETRAFTQVLLLKRQSAGYYIKTDTLHIQSKESSLALVPAIETAKQKNPLLSNSTVKRNSSTEEMVKKHQPSDSCMDCNVFTDSLQEKRQHLVSDFNDTVTNGASLVSKEQMSYVKEVTNKDNGMISVSKKSIDLAAESSCKSTPTVLYRSNCMSACGGSNTLSNTLHQDSLASNSERQSKSAPASVHRVQIHVDSPYACGATSRPMYNSNSDTVTGGEMFKQPELKSMFAARLPLAITPPEVCKLFSQYGRLQKQNAVRVFTGTTNCYACVTFESESEMRRVLETEIKMDGIEIVKEIWLPRDRRGRRTGKEIVRRPMSSHKMYTEV